MTGALTGLPAWLLQRATAVYMLIFVPAIALHYAADPPQSYEAWRAWMARPAVSVATLVFAAALLLHAWVGVRDVLLDYARPAAVRAAALALAAFGLLALAAWCARVLLAL